MDPKPRRGRLRRWAALLAALVCRGGAWVRRAAAALRNRLGRRRVAFFIVKPGGSHGEARSARTARGPSDDSDPGNRAAVQEERRGSSPSARARRLTGHHAHGEVGDASAAAALGPGEDAATSPGEHRKHGEQGSSRGNTDRSNQQGHRQEGGESPRGAALGEKTRNDEKNAEHGVEDIDGAKAHGVDAAAAAAATPGADGVALRCYPGGEPTKIGDRSVGVPPGAATHRKHGDPDVADEHDGENTGRSKNSSAPRAAPAAEEENPERGGGRIAVPTTTRQAAGINGAADGRCSGGERAQKGDNCVTPGPAEQEAENSGHSKKPSPEEENPERGGTRIASSTTTRRDSTRLAAGLTGAADGGCSRGDLSAAPGPAKEETHEGPAAPLDALPGAVLVQPGLAAAPAGGSGNVRDTSSRGRPRHLVRRKKKKHTADPLILPPDEEEDDAPHEEHDREIQLHLSYRHKSAMCRKNYIYCLMCHLNNEEKELEKDQQKIVRHCKTVHKCDSHGGIQCQKIGCLVRAKYKRDIGLHECVCHKMS